MLETNYHEEFCIAQYFEEDFIARLMEAGFLVMSTEIEETESPPPHEAFYILLPKLHLERSVLFFDALHIKKSIRRFLPLYELRVDTDFDLILRKCVQTHGSDWLTPPLVFLLKRLREDPPDTRRPAPVSFAVYRDGQLKAGEIGVIAGRVYTSYSGYHEEANSGTVQIILMTQWLEAAGFAFIDFGMPLDYKTELGAQNITPARFVELFRAAQ